MISLLCAFDLLWSSDVFYNEGVQAPASWMHGADRSVWTPDPIDPHLAASPVAVKLKACGISNLLEPDLLLD